MPNSGLRAADVRRRLFEHVGGPGEELFGSAFAEMGEAIGEAVGAAMEGAMDEMQANAEQMARQMEAAMNGQK